jgi:hypothetical protein
MHFSAASVSGAARSIVLRATLSNILDFSESSPQDRTVVLLNDTTGEVITGN